MSDTFEEFVTRFEAASPASRLRVMALIRAEMESEPDPEVDLDEVAAKTSVNPGQIERLGRAIAEAITYRAAQND